MKKRILTAFLAALMALSAIALVPVGAAPYSYGGYYIAGTLTFTAPEIEVPEGKREVTFGLEVSGVDTYYGISSVIAFVRINGATITQIERADLRGGSFATGDLPTEYASFMWVDVNGYFGSSLTAAYFTVELPESAEAGDEFEIEVILHDDIDLYNTAREYEGDVIDYLTESADGKITVTSPLHTDASYGDVNGDGKINSKDVTGMMKNIVGKRVSGFDPDAADVNTDGKVNSKDVMKLMKYIVGDKTARLGHNDVLTTIYASSCIEKGRGRLTCTVCGDTEEVELPLAAHKWNGGKITTAATYKKTGVKTYTCTVCGATKTETVPKLAPNWKKAYRDFAKSYLNWFASEAYLERTYALIDLNSDGTPELYMKHDSVSIGDVICTVDGDKANANYVWSVNSTLYYKPGGNLFLLVGTYTDGLGKIDLCKVSDGITVIRHGSYGSGGGILNRPLTWDTANGSQYGNDKDSIVRNAGMVKFDSSKMMTYDEFIDYIS